MFMVFLVGAGLHEREKSVIEPDSGLKRRLQ